LAPSVLRTKRKQSLYLPHRSAPELRRLGSSEPRLQLHRDTQKVWPVLAPTIMHQCCLPGLIIHQNEPARQRDAGVDQHARVRQSTEAKKEGGSLVRGTEGSDWTAVLASAETQVRARAVLPGSRRSEHHATGALPQSADNTCSTGHHLVERRQNKPATACFQMKRRSVEGLFRHPHRHFTHRRQCGLFAAGSPPKMTSSAEEGSFDASSSR